MIGTIVPSAGTGIVKHMSFEVLEENIRDASATLKAMGNPHRLMVLCKLSQGECSVGELESLVGLSQSALSQHLARMRRDGLVATRREAQTIYYSLSDQNVATLIKVLCDLYKHEQCAGLAQA